MGEDKETYEQSNEEYQYASTEDLGDEFSGEFAGTEEYEAPSESMSALPGVTRRKFLVPAIIIVVAAGVYMFMRYSAEPAAGGESVDAGPTSVEEKLSIPSPEPPVEQAAEEPPLEPPMPAVATTPEVVEPPVGEQTSFEAEQRALAAIQEKSSQDDAVIQNLQTTINQLQSTVGDLGKAIVGISEKVDKIEDVATKPVVRERKVRAQRRAARQVRPRVPPMVYEVKSVVPGRAWIQSGTGEFLSIGLGETLPGYGKVEKINAATGTVELSSGAVIKYGYDDR